MSSNMNDVKNILVFIENKKIKNEITSTFKSVQCKPRIVLSHRSTTYGCMANPAKIQKSFKILYKYFFSL